MGFSNWIKQINILQSDQRWWEGKKGNLYIKSSGNDRKGKTEKFFPKP